MAKTYSNREEQASQYIIEDLAAKVAKEKTIEDCKTLQDIADENDLLVYETN